MKRSPITVVAFGVLPVAAVALGAAAGVLQWQVSSHRSAETAAAESVQAARDTAEKILSYRASTVEQDLRAARQWLTDPFLASYTDLVDTVVIPGAQQRNMSAEAKVVAAASVSADEAHAVALVFIDQTTTAGSAAPTVIPSTVRVRLERVDGRWLVSGFDPI